MTLFLLIIAILFAGDGNQNMALLFVIAAIFI